MLRNMVRQRIGIPVHDDYFTDPVLNTNINLAISDIEAINRWPWSYRSEDIELDATGIYTLPDNWRTTQALTIDRNEVHEITDYDMHMRTRMESGIPEYFTIVDRELHVSPKPPGPTTAHHYYYVEPQLLSVDEDQPRIPSVHVGVIVAKAAQLCSVREDDRAAADAHMIEYMTGLERMRKSVRPTIRPTALRIRRGSWI
jgi:hypothetical protein